METAWFFIFDTVGRVGDRASNRGGGCTSDGGGGGDGGGWGGGGEKVPSPPPPSTYTIRLNEDLNKMTDFESNINPH